MHKSDSYLDANSNWLGLRTMTVTNTIYFKVIND